MSLEKIVAEAMAGRPLEMKEAFEEAIQEKITARLEEKYMEMMGESEELEEDLDEEELEEAKDEDEEDEDDEDEDEDEEDEDDK